jgi:hypothetical protein
MDIIKSITDKYDWSEKINNPKITDKWKKELHTNYGISNNVVNTIINLLKKYEHNETVDEKDEIDEHGYGYEVNYSRWKHTRIYVNYSSHLGFKCNCSCQICSGDERDNDDDYDEDDDDEKKEKTYLDIICKCEGVIDKKIKEFTDRYVLRNYELISSEIKAQFINNVNKLRDSIAVDYHPGSLSVIDLVHPSMYPYIHGVSEIIDTGASGGAGAGASASGGAGASASGGAGAGASASGGADTLLQWLPSEFSVDSDGKVSINSYINNLPKECNSELYSSIETIFSKFVPMFQNVIDKMSLQGFISNKKRTLAQCQVIVKIAETVLTPENPVFNDGESHWHLEGLPEEHIIATGIYYYDFKNITESRLSFRANMVGEDVYYKQDCPEMYELHSGLDSGGSGSGREFNQILEMGSIKTEEDLSIVFPNFMQHKVSSFALKDKTMVGSRKILVFFLIDPENPIISTAHVAPQQGIIPLEDAKIYRELLMYNRKYEIKHQDTMFSKRVYSLCEH